MAVRFPSTLFLRGRSRRGGVFGPEFLGGLRGTPQAGTEAVAQVFEVGQFSQGREVTAVRRKDDGFESRDGGEDAQVADLLAAIEDDGLERHAREGGEV